MNRARPAILLELFFTVVMWRDAQPNYYCLLFHFSSVSFSRGYGAWCGLALLNKEISGTTHASRPLFGFLPGNPPQASDYDPFSGILEGENVWDE